MFHVAVAWHFRDGAVITSAINDQGTARDLLFLPFAEDVGMSAGAVKGYDADFRVFLVEQQPVGIDVALPVALVVA